MTIAGQRKLSLIKDAILVTQAEIRNANRPIKIHVLGTGNPHILPFYVEQRIDSFDSSTWLRKAWLDNRYNYFEVSDNCHKAHRATRIGLGPLDPDSLEWNTSVTCSCSFLPRPGPANPSLPRPRAQHPTRLPQRLPVHSTAQGATSGLLKALDIS